MKSWGLGIRDWMINSLRLKYFTEKKSYTPKKIYIGLECSRIATCICEGGSYFELLGISGTQF